MTEATYIAQLEAQNLWLYEQARAQAKEAGQNKLHWEHQNGLLEAEIERLRAALRIANDALAQFCSMQLSHAENYRVLGNAWKETRTALDRKP